MSTRRPLRRLWLAILAVVLSAAVAPTAQTPAPRPSDYAQEALVVERLAVSEQFDANGTQTRDTEMSVRVQSAAGVQQMGTLAIAYARETDELEFRFVRVHKPDGTTVETPVSSAIEMPAEITRAAPTFTDTYVKNMNVQGLGVGDVVEYATHLRQRSLIPGQFWLEDNLVKDAIVLSAELRVSIPQQIAATVKSAETQPMIETTGGNRVYTWRYANLKTPTDKEAAIRKYARRDIRADIQITSFPSWEALGAAVRDLWRGRADVTPAIRDKARELTQSARTDAEKLQALYAFVSTKIRYVAISFGIGRYQPHAAAEVLTSGYGDCKDKHTLLVALLDAAGIHADAVLLTPGEPLDQDVPSPGQFDHVITFVPGISNGVWLDTTMEIAPLGMLLPTERDHRVLRIPVSGAATVVKTPVEPARANLWTTDVIGALDASGTLTATVTEIYSGDLELAMRSVFRAVAQARWPEFVGRISLGQRYGGTASDVAITSPEDTTTPFRLTYHYSAPNFSDWANKRIAAPMPLMGFPGLSDTEDPPTPVPLGAGVKIRSTSQVEWPEGYEAGLAEGALPELTADASFASYRLRNTLTGRTFKTEREAQFKTDELTAAQFAEYRTFFKSIGDGPRTITLKAFKPWAFGDSATIDWYSGAAPAAVSTMRAAVAASNRGDHQNALSLLDGLTREEPKNAAAGVLLGWVQIQSGDRDRGIQTMQRQMALTPTSSGYKHLALRLRSAGRREEAIQAWTHGRELFPDDREFPLYLGELLVDAERYADAVPVLEGQVPTQRASARLEWDLALAYLGLKQQEPARAAFARTIELDPTPERLNNIAWRLVEARDSLDIALTYSQRAVKGIEDESGRLQLSRLDTPTVRLMSAMAAYWDTLAWVHFREGHVAYAEGWMLAAWDLSPNGTFAEHLGEIYEASGDRDTAATFYAMALAADQPEAAAAPRLQALVQDPRLRASKVSGAPAALAASRAVSVPRIPGIEGHAQVFLRVGSGGAVDDVRFIGGDAAMRPAAEMIRAVKVPSRLPPESQAHLVRSGTLSCEGEATSCTLSLLPAARVAAVP